VDVAIDQGGCIETARPTTHSEPSFVVDGVVHYCVTNMPAAVPNTSTLALTNATFPYVMKLANGPKAAIQADPGFSAGVNTWNGALTCEPVAQSQGRKWQPVAELVA
jgi:alanine dehydrogenase